LIFRIRPSSRSTVVRGMGSLFFAALAACLCSAL
jgi:hypothetical protein